MNQIILNQVEHIEQVEYWNIVGLHMRKIYQTKLNIIQISHY